MSDQDENIIPEVDWEDVKDIYLQSEGNLMLAASEYGISVPDILIEARKEGWGDRGSRSETKAIELGEEKLNSDKDIVAGHKSTAFNVRELISDQLKQIGDYKGGIKETVGMIKSLSDSLVKIVNIERQAHEIDTAVGDSPDSIIINMDGKRVEVSRIKPQPNQD